jgi:hypothetical protein
VPHTITVAIDATVSVAGADVESVEDAIGIKIQVASIADAITT